MFPVVPRLLCMSFISDDPDAKYAAMHTQKKQDDGRLVLSSIGSIGDRGRMAVAESAFTVGAIALLASPSTMWPRGQDVFALHSLVLGLQTLQLFVCLAQPSIEILELLFV